MNLFKLLQLVAHEIGHNLNMRHDFSGSPGSVRTARNGQRCTGINGIMDYTSNRNKWSACSSQDMNDYHNSIVRSRGEFCLKNKGEFRLFLISVFPQNVIVLYKVIIL